LRVRLPAELAVAWSVAREEWREVDGTRRLWERDASLWTGSDEDQWLGWLEAPETARSHLDRYAEIAADSRRAGFAHVLVLGMGGSSLAPAVQGEAFGALAGFPRLHVLDSIHPAAIAATTAELELERTLLVVASKSGSTLEPSLLFAHFEALLRAKLGRAAVGSRCLAITDPESKLEAMARERGFRRIVLGEPTIGGRYSALSPFGLVPAALQGIDLALWVSRAERMSALCRLDAAEANPGVALGLLVASAAALGREKLTLVTHPRIALFGAWLEQLVAESTGKQGVAILPIDGETLAAPERYGDDRLFVALRSGGELAAGDDEKLAALSAAGHPVVEIEVDDAFDLASEYVRWETATAVVGARLGIHPFDQPDVESAKIETRRLSAEIEQSGGLPAEEPLAASSGLALFAPEAQAGLLLSAAGPRRAPRDLLRAHLQRLQAGDYFALLIFAALSPANLNEANRIRNAVRAWRQVATSAGFGPRYLHSTGQAHKGGPPSGVFLMVTDEPRADLPVPGQKLSFGQAIAAQARGDAAVLAARGRRILRVHLGGAAEELLPVLATEIELALAEAGTP
jgi:transaldolase/glucose-6-phosphate isomerase